MALPIEDTEDGLVRGFTPQWALLSPLEGLSFLLEGPSLPDAHTSQVPALLELSVGEQRSAVLPPLTIRGRLAQGLLRKMACSEWVLFPRSQPIASSRRKQLGE